MRIKRLNVYNVLTEQCAADLDAQVGGKIIVCDVSPVVGKEYTMVRYWTGEGFRRTYSDAFTYWGERGGLSRNLLPSEMWSGAVGTHCAWTPAQVAEREGK